jgi:hypothetical protein
MSNDQSIRQALRDAKTRRGEARTAMAETEIRAAADAADVLACEGHVITLSRARAAAIVAAKPTAVIAVDAELLRASVVGEIAAARSVSSAAKHTETVAALRAAETDVRDSAKRVIDCELIELAGRVTSGLDAVLALGEQLRELSLREGFPTTVGARSTVPPEVERALARLPQPNPYDVPMDVLRGGVRSDAWARRLAELIADDESESIACHSKPRVEVGAHSRVAEANGGETRVPCL